MVPLNDSIPLKMAQLHLQTTQSHLKILGYLPSSNYSQLWMFLVHKLHPVVAIGEVTVGFSPKMEHTCVGKETGEGVPPLSPQQTPSPYLRDHPGSPIPTSFCPMATTALAAGWGHPHCQPLRAGWGDWGPNEMGTREREREGAPCCRFTRNSQSQCPFRS